MAKLLILILMFSYILSCGKRENKIGERKNYPGKLPTEAKKKKKEVKKAKKVDPIKLKQDFVEEITLKKNFEFSVNDQIYSPIHLELENDAWKKEVRTTLMNTKTAAFPLEYPYSIQLKKGGEIIKIKRLATNRTYTLAFADDQNFYQEILIDKDNTFLKVKPKTKKIHFKYLFPNESDYYKVKIYQDNITSEFLVKDNFPIKDFLSHIRMLDSFQPFLKSNNSISCLLYTSPSPRD